MDEYKYNCCPEKRTAKKGEIMEVMMKKNYKKFFCIYFLGAFISCITATYENPSEMFVALYEKYRKTEYKTIVLSQQGEGAGMFVFDINKTISEDTFCQIFLNSSLGQTQYFVFKKDGENIWYFHKKVYIYEEPFELENAEILNTYFKFIDDLPYAFNDATGKYDIQADTNEYLAITDVRSLTDLIEIVQNTINDIE
jgi:hypothetical protein